MPLTSHFRYPPKYIVICGIIEKGGRAGSSAADAKRVLRFADAAINKARTVQFCLKQRRLVAPPVAWEFAPTFGRRLLALLPAQRACRHPATPAAGHWPGPPPSCRCPPDCTG